MGFVSAFVSFQQRTGDLAFPASGCYLVLTCLVSFLSLN